MTERRRLLLGLVLPLTAALAAACGGASSATVSPGGPSARASGPVIELELTGDLKIRQDGQQVSTIPVKAGETYTFRITNTAGYDHDFYIATDAELSRGEGGHHGVAPFSGGTHEFTYTFDAPGPLAFGCTIPGHYAVMKGVFDIQP